jgi:hypothetical protein
MAAAQRQRNHAARDHGNIEQYQYFGGNAKVG